MCICMCACVCLCACMYICVCVVFLCSCFVCIFKKDKKNVELKPGHYNKIARVNVIEISYF